ncbi:MAG: tetratricopeptide repeat protein [Algoriphagus sp.]
MRTLLGLMYLFLLGSCSTGSSVPEKEYISSIQDSLFTTPLGKVFAITTPSAELVSNYDKAMAAYEARPEEVEAWIWWGRRSAYLGQIRRAIAIYSLAIDKFPNEARLYRHRGHRYLSIREYGKAIADLEEAACLIEGVEDQIEPDGIPNALQIPLSTLHTNTYYHLGLGYYLTHRYEDAYQAFLRCRESGTNYDNVVSSTHWLYMIQRRLGNEARADSLLAPIEKNAEVIENQSYAMLCSLYKGWISPESLVQETPGSPSNDAVRYGLANWYLYHGDSSRAQDLFRSLVEEKGFTSFGYLAAESDLLQFFPAPKNIP